MKSVEENVIKIVGDYLLRESPLPSLSRREEDVIKIVGDYLGIPPFKLSLETRIVGDNYGIPSFKLSTETKLLEDLRIHPIDLRELIMTVEEKFEVKISTEEVASIARIQDIVDAVKRKLESE